MQFMILCKADKGTEVGTPPSAAFLSAMQKYNATLTHAGVMRRANTMLKPSVYGTRIKRSAGQWSAIDGPFTDTLIASFSIIDVPSKQEAIDWIKKWPTMDGDVEIEIREAGCSSECIGFDETTSPAAMPSNAGKGLRRFMILFKSDEEFEADVRYDEEVIGAMMKHNADAAKAGVVLACEGLQASAKGARVKLAGGKTSFVDGPFTEVKEMIAGFWLIQVESKQAAIEWAMQYPYPRDEVVIEIREVFDTVSCDFTPELRDAEQRMRAHLLESSLFAELATPTAARRR